MPCRLSFILHHGLSDAQQAVPSIHHNPNKLCAVPGPGHPRIPTAAAAKKARNHPTTHSAPADQFGKDLITAGGVGSLFGLMNLFSRTAGGLASDYVARDFGMRGRLWLLFGTQVRAQHIAWHVLAMRCWYCSFRWDTCSQAVGGYCCAKA